MSSAIVNASLAVSLFLKDEFSPSAVRSVAFLRSIDRRLVPSHFFVESINALLMAERRGRGTRVEIMEAVRGIVSFPVLPDIETTHRCGDGTIELARQFHLTIYDAAYLELALRESAVLATVDRALARAAKASGLEVVP